MNTIRIIVMAIVGLLCLWALSSFFSKRYVKHASPPKKEKFVADNRLLRVPDMPSEETHDVLAYSLGY